MGGWLLLFGQLIQKASSPGFPTPRVEAVHLRSTVLPLSLSISPPTIGAQALHKMAEKTFKVLNTFFVSNHGRFLPFPVSGIRSHRPPIASAATA